MATVRRSVPLVLPPSLFCISLTPLPPYTHTQPHPTTTGTAITAITTTTKAGTCSLQTLYPLIPHQNPPKKRRQKGEKGPSALTVVITSAIAANAGKLWPTRTRVLILACCAVSLAAGDGRGAVTVLGATTCPAPEARARARLGRLTSTPPPPPPRIY